MREEEDTLFLIQKKRREEDLILDPYVILMVREKGDQQK
jgi:hypothetical protein